MAGRKDMAEKARKLKEEIERKEASAATKNMQSKLRDIFKKQGTIDLS